MGVKKKTVRQNERNQILKEEREREEKLSTKQARRHVFLKEQREDALNKLGLPADLPAADLVSMLKAKGEDDDMGTSRKSRKKVILTHKKDKEKIRNKAAIRIAKARGDVNISALKKVLSKKKRCNQVKPNGEETSSARRLRKAREKRDRKMGRNQGSDEEE